MTQQFSQMGMGGQPAPQQPQPPQQPGVQLRLNPLQPVDISMQGQPLFDVRELDQPPPPIILPPNVSLFRYI